MLACDIIPCPSCGRTPIEHDPEMGAPDPCAGCQAQIERTAAAIFYRRRERAALALARRGQRLAALEEILAPQDAVHPSFL